MIFRPSRLGGRKRAVVGRNPGEGVEGGGEGLGAGGLSRPTPLIAFTNEFLGLAILPVHTLGCVHVRYATSAPVSMSTRKVVGSRQRLCLSARTPGRLGRL
jgi:hypothetical protein